MRGLNSEARVDSLDHITGRMSISETHAMSSGHRIYAKISCSKQHHFKFKMS